MRGDEEILRLLTERKQTFAASHRRMRDFAEVYNGDKKTVLPELHLNEKPAVPNLIQQHTDQLAMRIASVTPQLYFPPVRAGIGKSERLARIRKEVMGGIHLANHLPHLMRERARQFIGFGMQPTWVRYREDLGRPFWDLCNAEFAFPAIGRWDNPVAPPDMIFCYQRPLWWIKQNYPEQVAGLRVGDSTTDTLFELVHYLDDEQSRLIVLGRSSVGGGSYTSDSAPQNYVVLEESENLSGMQPVTVTQRIGINRSNGAHDASIGLYERQARMMALEEIAVERAIFPEPWLEPLDATATPQVVVPADGRNGQIGIVRGGRLQWEQISPQLAALQVVDRGERAIRTTAGIPADFGGESASNVRTGRRGDSIVSNTVDFHVQEAQELFAEAIAYENRVAIKVDRAFGGRRPKKIAVGFAGTGKLRTYTPADLWETDEHYVKFAAPGSDLASLNVQLAQKVGTGEMSVRTARELDPMVDDPDQEERRVTYEQLEKGILGEFQTPGTMTLPDKARVMQLIIGKEAETVVDAILKVQMEAQQRQSTTVNPAEPGSPDAQPGIAPAGAGQEAGTTIPPVPPSLDNLSQLFQSIRSPNRPMPSMPAQPPLAGTVGR